MPVTRQSAAAGKGTGGSGILVVGAVKGIHTTALEYRCDEFVYPEPQPHGANPTPWTSRALSPLAPQAFAVLWRTLLRHYTQLEQFACHSSLRLPAGSRGFTIIGFDVCWMSTKPFSVTVHSLTYQKVLIPKPPKS